MKCTKCEKNRNNKSFCFKNKVKRRKHTVCRFCQREYKIKYYYQNKESHYKRNEEKRARLRQIVIDCKKTGCCNCDEKEQSCLDFHHLSDKKFLISGIHAKGSLSKLLLELKKCVVICANCHRKLHAGLIEIKNTGLVLDDKVGLQNL